MPTVTLTGGRRRGGLSAKLFRRIRERLSRKPDQPVAGACAASARPDTGERPASVPQMRSGGRRRARAHHYGFAHQFLRDLFFDDPRRMMLALAGPGSDEVLERMWDIVGDSVAARDGEDVRLPPAGLAAAARAIGQDTHAVIISLPPPEKQAEAHFVGMIVRAADAAARYVTLERAHEFHGPPSGTLLCEWSGKRMHAIVGPGTEPTVEAFARALEPLAQPNAS